MNWEAMFQSDYIRAVDFGARVFNGEISEARLCQMEDEKTGKARDKGVVFFKGQPKGWVLCKTNAMCLAAMFGPETNGWIGKRVTLFAALVSVGKEKKPGIRVKGSPDLTKPTPVEIKLPRKKAFTMVMQPTGKNAPTEPPPADGPPDEPPHDSSPIVEPVTGEAWT